MMRFWGLMVVLAGCTDGSNGTAVGNPGEMDVVLVGVPPDVQLRQAEFSVAAVELVSCDRRVQVLQVNTVFDVLSPSPVEMPAGSWCNTIVLPAGKDSLTLVGEGPGGEFDLVLSPEPFALDGEYEIDGNTVLVTLSLQERSLAGEEADIDPGAPDSGLTPPEDELFDADLVVAEGLYIDENDDYLAGDDELAAVVTETEGCGCSTSSTPGWGLLLLGLAGMLQRRRVHAHPSPAE